MELDKTTKLFIESVKDSNYHLTESLLQKGDVDVNNIRVQWIAGETGAFLGTALHYAAWKCDTRMVELLLLYNANVNITSTVLGMTPLYYAAMSDSTDVIKVLLRYQADDADVNITSEILGITPLHCAAITDSKDVIEILLRHQADINKTDKYGHTVLHYAAIKNSIKVTELLIERGVDVNQCSTNGQTALYRAADMGSTECALILLQHGADATLTNDAGYTALMIAEKRNNKATADAITEFINSRSSMETHNMKPVQSTKEMDTDESMTDDTMAVDDFTDKNSSPKYTPVYALLSEDKSELVLPQLAINDNQDSTGIAYTLAGDANRIRKLPKMLGLPAIPNEYPAAIKGKPTEIQLKDLSRDIGYEWRRIASGLGISYKEQEQIRMDFPFDSQQEIMEMLMRWRARVQDKTEEERCAILKRALMEEGRKDLADTL